MALLVTLLATNIGGIATSAPNPLVGELVPAVSGVTLNGDAFDIDDHRGSWLAVNFFASWCVACRQEHPELVAWRADHSASGDAELLTIVMGDTDEAVRRFFEERGGGDWPVLGEDYWSYSLAFGVTAVPETFMVAPSGMIVAHLTGAVTADELDAVIERHSPATARPTSRDPSAGPSPAPE
ncbi:MAG: TlpA family protein disulfide reductase [Acidimicrobiales bacterium]